VKKTLLVLPVLAAVLAAAPAALADPSPVTVVKAPKLGAIVATKAHLALYAWNRERDGKVRCIGACAKQWPPLTVSKGTMLARHVAGVMGTFGQVMRPDGSHQVTLNHRPLYTYVGDTATKILCNGVDGWFVVHA
jgi:predicted lipoprotein with Yx(FWY)xxD motif